MKNIKRIAVVLFCVMFIIAGAVTPVSADGTSAEQWELTELPETTDTYSPIPLLCIKISYDANGNGKNDFDPAQPNKLTDMESEFYGEQWSYSADSYWANMLFGKTGKTLYNFYRINSGGAFYFTPAEENFGSPNDGVVTVIINSKHPNATSPTNYTADNSSRLRAIEAASAYVDFSKFDKDGDGAVSRTELAVLFVCGGYEYSSWKKSTKFAFGTHAHYTSGSGTVTDGVTVLRSTGYVRIGEYVSQTACNPIGTVAHEFCHYLGEPDLYDTSSNGSWTSYTSTMSLMSSGSHSNYSGESRGTSPSNIDPLLSDDLGFVNALTVIEGEYTMYSRQSTKGDYNVLKINTPNPDEFYLVENRYSTQSEGYFDALTAAQKGIVIWHIDGVSLASNVNDYSTYTDPAIVTLGPNGITSTYCGYRFIPGADENGNKNLFSSDSPKYSFPISKGPYTLLTEEETENFLMQIEILSEQGNEMTVRVKGGYKLPPASTGNMSEATTDTLTLSGKITDLNGGNATKCGFIISTKTNPTTETGTVIYSKPDETGMFTATFEGLKAGTKYFCCSFVEGDYGTQSYKFNAYTNSIPVVHDYSIVRFYRGVTEVERTYDVKLYPGNALKYNFPMEKEGYTFCGWFCDSEYTVKYDMSTVQKEIKDFTLYARWIPENKAATLVLEGASAKFPVFPTEQGDTFVLPVLNEKPGYVFEGYYADAEYTVIYDFENPTDTSGEIKVYVKWTSTGAPETTAPAQTTASTPKPETTAVPETTDTTVNVETTETTAFTGTETDVPEDENAGTVRLIYAGVAIIVVVALAFVYNRIAVKRKKDNGTDDSATVKTEETEKTSEETDTTEESDTTEETDTTEEIDTAEETDTTEESEAEDNSDDDTEVADETKKPKDTDKP